MSGLEVDGPFVEEIDDALAKSWEQQIEDADRELREVRVTFRWQAPQVAVVKRAAARFGVPYQTYLKQVVFRQALADLNASRIMDDPIPPVR